MSFKFSRVIVVGEEVRGPDYWLDNATRPQASHAVVQLTVSGEGLFRHAGCDIRVGPGKAMLFTHSEATGYGYPPDGDDAYRLRFVTFEPGGLRGLFDQVRAEFGPVVAIPPRGRAALRLAELMRGFTERGFCDRLEETQLLQDLLIEIHRAQIVAREQRDPVAFGHDALLNEFRGAVSVKTLADRCGVSREHFIREFRRRYGETPGGMLRRLRLEHARAMLKATRASVADVAALCGFSDSNSFCRAYRATFGRSPGRERLL